MEEAGPRSGSFHSLNAQTTFLSGVTSSTWTVPGQFLASFTSAGHQLQITVLPLARRLASWKMKHLYSGTSFSENCQTTSPCLFTSSTVEW
jgi:hypothetical protein